MKILVDMNLSPRWASFLVEAGFEAVHWSAVGAGTAPDTELMQWAAEHGHIVLTADLDFGAILAATQTTRPSVVQVRSDILTPRAIGGAVVTAIKQNTTGIVGWSTRVRRRGARKTAYPAAPRIAGFRPSGRRATSCP